MKMPPPKKKPPMDAFIEAARGAEDPPAAKIKSPQPSASKKEPSPIKANKQSKQSKPSAGEELRLNRGEVSHWSVAGDKHKGTYYLPLELRARLVAFASTQGLNASEVVERAVEEFIGSVEEE